MPLDTVTQQIIKQMLFGDGSLQAIWQRILAVKEASLAREATAAQKKVAEARTEKDKASESPIAILKALLTKNSADLPDYITDSRQHAIATAFSQTASPRQPLPSLPSFKAIGEKQERKRKTMAALRALEERYKKSLLVYQSKKLLLSILKNEQTPQPLRKRSLFAAAFEGAAVAFLATALCFAVAGMIPLLANLPFSFAAFLTSAIIFIPSLMLINTLRAVFRRHRKNKLKEHLNGIWEGSNLSPASVEEDRPSTSDLCSHSAAETILYYLNQDQDNQGPKGQSQQQTSTTYGANMLPFGFVNGRDDMYDEEDYEEDPSPLGAQHPLQLH